MSYVYILYLVFSLASTWVLEQHNSICFCQTYGRLTISDFDFDVLNGGWKYLFSLRTNKRIHLTWFMDECLIQCSLMHADYHAFDSLQVLL